jgi:hypothetical protein
MGYSLLLEDCSSGEKIVVHNFPEIMDSKTFFGCGNNVLSVEVGQVSTQ